MAFWRDLTCSRSTGHELRDVAASANPAASWTGIPAETAFVDIMK